MQRRTLALGFAIAILGPLAPTALADRALPPKSPDPDAELTGPPAGNSGAPDPAAASRAAGIGGPSAIRRPPRPAPPPAPPPKPDPQIAIVGKAHAGVWKCKGVAFVGDGSSTPLTATATTKLVLGDAWIETDLVETGARSIRFTEVSTYDPIAEHWTRFQAATTSAYVQSSSGGEVDGVWDWNGIARSPAGQATVVNREKFVGNELTLWGDTIVNGAWEKTYLMRCRR